MKGNAYNDLWVILENLDKNAADKIPQKYKDFVKEQMIEGGESEVDESRPLEGQTFQEDTRNLLACLTLTYWSNDEGRYEFAKRLHKNEMDYQGRTGTEMTSEDYHYLLQGFDDWNDWFGPIPEWPKTRHWYPWVLYEITSKEEADIIIGNTGLREVYVTKDVRDRILEEAKEWVLVADKKEEETLLWHDDDYSSWTSTELIEDFYKKHAVVRDGHFIGALIETENTSSYGMAVDRTRDWGVLFTDGTTDGETRQHYSHCSTEIDRSEDIQYSLRRKQDADEDK